MISINFTGDETSWSDQALEAWSIGVIVGSVGGVCYSLSCFYVAANIGTKMETIVILQNDCTCVLNFKFMHVEQFYAACRCVFLFCLHNNCQRVIVEKNKDIK